MEDKYEMSKLLLKLDKWIAYEEAQEKKKKQEEKKWKDEERRKKMEDDLTAYELKLEMMEKRDQKILEIIEA